MRADGEGLVIGEASCEAERNEKKVDGVGHAECVDVDELKVQFD